MSNLSGTRRYILELIPSLPIPDGSWLCSRSRTLAGPLLPPNKPKDESKYWRAARESRAAREEGENGDGDERRNAKKPSPGKIRKNVTDGPRESLSFVLRRKKEEPAAGGEESRNRLGEKRADPWRRWDVGDAKEVEGAHTVVWWPRASACLCLSWDEEAWKKEKGEREKEKEKSERERERESLVTGFRKNRIGERRIEEIEIEKKRSRKNVCMCVCVCVAKRTNG